MKKTIYFYLSLFVFGITGFSSCDKTGDDFSNQDTAMTVNDGEWKVSWFWDKDKDETSHFSGYTFKFSDHGKLQAIRNNQVTHTGSWVRSSSGSKLIIDMGTTQPLDELNDDWIIKVMENDAIMLQDDNDEHLEELHFSKK